MMIRRHSTWAIRMHWFNAACWIFLLLSGFALLANEEMQPIGPWWSELWTAAFGRRGLLISHIAVGTAWVIAYALFILVRRRQEVVPFIRNALQFQGRSDVIWCFKKGLWLIGGPSFMQRHGIAPALPPQGFYNAGQRMVAVIAVFSSFGLAVTGVIMSYFPGTATPEKLLQWCIVLHFCCAGIMAVFLQVHIYMAAIALDERPALLSMITGLVPEEHARRHNALWHDEWEKLHRQEADNNECVHKPG